MRERCHGRGAVLAAVPDPHATPVVVIVMSSDLTFHLLICLVSTTLSVGWYCLPAAIITCYGSTAVLKKINKCMKLISGAAVETAVFLNA